MSRDTPRERHPLDGTIGWHPSYTHDPIYRENERKMTQSPFDIHNWGNIELSRELSFDGYEVDENGDSTDIETGYTYSSHYDHYYSGNYIETVVIAGPSGERTVIDIRGMLNEGGVIYHSQVTYLNGKIEDEVTTYIKIHGLMSSILAVRDDGYKKWGILQETYQCEDPFHVEIIGLRVEMCLKHQYLYRGCILKQHKNSRPIMCNCKLIEKMDFLHPLLGTPGWNPCYLECDIYLKKEEKMKELPFDPKNWERNTNRCQMEVPVYEMNESERRAQEEQTHVIKKRKIEVLLIDLDIRKGDKITYKRVTNNETNDGGDRTQPIQKYELKYKDFLGGFFKQEVVVTGPWVKTVFQTQGNIEIGGVMWHKIITILDGGTREWVETYLVIDGPLTTLNMVEEAGDYVHWGTMRKADLEEDGLTHLCEDGITQRIVLFIKRCKFAGRVLMQVKNGITTACNCELIDNTIRLGLVIGELHGLAEGDTESAVGLVEGVVDGEAVPVIEDIPRRPHRRHRLPTRPHSTRRVLVERDV